MMALMPILPWRTRRTQDRRRSGHVEKRPLRGDAQWEMAELRHCGAGVRSVSAMGQETLRHMEGLIMSIADIPDHDSGNHEDQAHYVACIADENFNFQDFSFDDRKVTGAQIAEAMGAHPVTQFVVLQQLKSFELEALRPTELADLAKSLRFFVIQGDATYNFVIDGLNMVWPKKVITGQTIKRLIYKDDNASELLLEREDQPDKVIGNEDQVRLSNDGVESFRTRPAKAAITIIVEGTQHAWDKEKISYDEVVTLEVPDYAQHPEITYSVKFKNGPGNRPEGTLAKGASVKVKDGMIFSVSETGQS